MPDLPAQATRDLPHPLATSTAASPQSDITLEEADLQADLRKDHKEDGYERHHKDKLWSSRSWVYELTPFRGMLFNLHRRAPYYLSDWIDALPPKDWYYIVSGTLRMYFINVMPAIAYILDLELKTKGAYGINEALLSSTMPAIIFSLFAAQPLTIVGITGLIALFNYTTFDIVITTYGLTIEDYLRFQAWVGIWSAVMHWLMAIFNITDLVRFITDMTSEAFGMYVGIIYIVKGVELLVHEFSTAPGDAAGAIGWFSIGLSLLFTFSVYYVAKVGETNCFSPFLRRIISDYAFAAGIVFWTGFANIPLSALNGIRIDKLVITKSFLPTFRGAWQPNWLVDFWTLEGKWIGVAIPFGFLLTLLFYFDHNVSSIMAQSRVFPVKKPAGFHWDFFLLGVTTFIAGILGLPAPNGLVPQAPVHTESLTVTKKSFDEKGRAEMVTTRVVEQRLTHLAMGLLCLGTMTRPLLVALGTMPNAIFAGVFFYVGWGSIESNTVTKRTLFLLQDRDMVDAAEPLLRLRKSKVALFVAIQWLFIGATVGTSQTIAAIGFPVIILALIPLRFYVGPKLFSRKELEVLDQPTADAPLVFASIGHEKQLVTAQLNGHPPSSM